MAKYEITAGVISGPVKAVLYGPEGIGKSTFASRFPDPVFIDTEGGTKRLNVRRLPAPDSWAMLLDEAQETAHGNIPCQTLVIDTADWAERLCIETVCARAKKSGIEDFGYGKGYVYVRDEFAKLLDILTEVVVSGRNVVVLAHAQISKFELPDAAGNFDRWTLKLGKHTAPVLREWCDTLLFVNYKTYLEKAGEGKSAKNKASGGRRVMFTTHHACWDAKNRFDLPEETDFEYSVLAPFVPGSVTENPIHVTVASVLPAANQPGTGSSTANTVITQPAAQSRNAAPSTVSSHRPAARDTESAPAPEKEPVLLEEDAPVPSMHDIVEESRAENEKQLAAEKVPEKLRRLMVANNVDSWMLRHSVHLRGCYPEDTPIAKYDPEFVNGSLLASWAKWLEFIQNNSDFPF